MIPAHFPLERLARALDADGIKCVIRPNAQGKSARRFSTAYGASRDGYYVGCQAIVEHHTVSSGLNPENDLAFIDGGKGDGYTISNAYTALDGTVHLIASGPTYTEGAGGPLGIIPENRGNDVSFSNEIASWGAPLSVYPQEQQDAVAAFAHHAAIIAADVWDWPDDPFAPHRTFAHFEWAPTRKVDPRGVSRWSPDGGMWDMDAFRAELRNNQPPPGVPPVRYILKPPTERAGGPWFLRWDGSWSYLTGRDRDLARAEGLPEFDDLPERYDLVRAEVFGPAPGV